MPYMVKFKVVMYILIDFFLLFWLPKLLIVIVKSLEIIIVCAFDTVYFKHFYKHTYGQNLKNSTQVEPVLT